MKLLIVKVEKYVLQIAEASSRGKKVTLNIGDIYEQNSKERRGILFPKLMTNLAISPNF